MCHENVNKHFSYQQAARLWIIQGLRAVLSAASFLAHETKKQTEALMGACAFYVRFEF